MDNDQLVSAEIHPLTSDLLDEEAQEALTEREVVPPIERSVYLDAYLAPFKPFLERDTVTEIIVNRPGEVWIEDATLPGMKRIVIPRIDDQLVQRLAEQVARVSHQGINREHPLLRRNFARWRACAILRSACRAQTLGHGHSPPSAAGFAAGCL